MEKIRNLFENNPRYWSQNVFLAYEDLEKTSVHYYSLRFFQKYKTLISLYIPVCQKIYNLAPTVQNWTVFRSTLTCIEHFPTAFGTISPQLI